MKANQERIWSLKCRNCGASPTEAQLLDPEMVDRIKYTMSAHMWRCEYCGKVQLR